MARMQVRDEVRSATVRLRHAVEATPLPTIIGLIIDVRRGFGGSLSGRSPNVARETPVHETRGSTRQFVSRVRRASTSVERARRLHRRRRPWSIETGDARSPAAERETGS
jgi:hypothetical protein